LKFLHPLKLCATPAFPLAHHLHLERVFSVLENIVKDSLDDPKLTQLMLLLHDDSPSAARRTMKNNEPIIVQAEEGALRPEMH
jgi:hypothetical protein